MNNHQFVIFTDNQEQIICRMVEHGDWIKANDMNSDVQFSVGNVMAQLFKKGMVNRRQIPQTCRWEYVINVKGRKFYYQLMEFKQELKDGTTPMPQITMGLEPKDKDWLIAEKKRLKSQGWNVRIKPIGKRFALFGSDQS